MGTPADIRAADLRLVTTQAVVERLFRAQVGEGDYLRLIPFAGHVLSPRAMATLTTLLLEFDFFVTQALGMRIAIKVLPDVRMAGAAHLAS